MSESNAQFIEWQAAGGVGRLTVERPPLNIYNIPMLHELSAALETAAQDETLRVLVMRARGKMFSAGLDVADHTAENAPEAIPLFNQVCRSLAEFPAPTLAVVHGHALGGGCELAICCDLVLAAEGAKFGQPEIKLASFPPVAALRLTQSVSYRRAAEMVLTGELVEAVEAARIGLINRAVPAEELEEAVEQIVSRLVALSAPALRVCKQALRLGADGWAGLPEVERLYFDDLLATEDAHEGLAAFMEKRQPEWKHR